MTDYKLFHIHKWFELETTESECMYKVS